MLQKKKKKKKLNEIINKHGKETKTNYIKLFNVNQNEFLI